MNFMAMPSEPTERVSLRLFIVNIIVFVSTGLGLNVFSDLLHFVRKRFGEDK